ncbi:MAG TPA: hypothetical protein VND20_00625, partial [Candidatus Binataceae bacterium]|nr:hypothetical protein [Candidatus Binataceae bacterium]
GGGLLALYAAADERRFCGALRTAPLKRGAFAGMTHSPPLARGAHAARQNLLIASVRRGRHS